MTMGAGSYNLNFGSGTRLTVRPRKSNAAPMFSLFCEAFGGVVESSSMAGCLVTHG